MITPNLPEARVLAGDARRRRRRGARRRAAPPRPDAVVVTGGHRDEATDVFFDGDARSRPDAAARHPDGAAHGSGCTHSCALAAHLALGDDPLDAPRGTRVTIASEAVRDGLRELGAGAGPVDVFGLRHALRSWRAGGESACSASGIIGLDEVPAHAPGSRRAADRRGRP